VHELSLTQNLLEIAEDHARRAGARVIRTITVQVGDLSGALPEALEFAFDVCSKGTLAEGATLILQRIPGHGHCANCQAAAPAGTLSAVCPSCGQLTFAIDAGTELHLLELEID
jgi:hydrogenase nickel incorporation protein HypA/HybF